MSDIRKAIMERLGAVAEGEKATMSKASDALNYIKNSIASGKTVYVSAGHRITKVTPKAYAKWEASGKPLFKLGNDGALLMASGSSYVRLTMGDEMMLAGITAMSRPGAKAEMGMRDTKGRGPFTLQYIASGLYGEPTWLLVDKANKVVAKEHNEQSAKEMLRKANAGEPVYVSSRTGAKAAFDRRIEVDHWTSPKGTKYVAGVHERGGGTSFQPFISATYSDGGEQLMTGNAPTFKTEKGARKWLDTEIGRRKSVSSRPGAKARMEKSAALAIVGKAVSSVPAGPQRDALQKALIDYYDNTQASNRLLQQGKLTDATRFDVEAGRAVQIAIRVWDRMGKPAAELRGYTQNLERAAEFSRPGAKATAAKPDETEREDVKAGLKLMEKADQAVSDKIRTLIKEGKPQDQAVAIALDMKRRGEL